MKLTPKIQKAISRASVLHLGQKRKGDGAPYILHPYSVAFILSHYTNDEDIIVAGLLHDVLEDVDGYEKEDLQKEFGERVANMVSDVTEDISLKEDKGEKESWVERKTNILIIWTQSLLIRPCFPALIKFITSALCLRHIRSREMNFGKSLILQATKSFGIMS